MDETTQAHFRHPKGLRALWLGLLAGPIAWAIQFQVSYALTPYVCQSRWVIALYATSFGAFALAALGFWSAYHSWVLAGREHHAAGASVVGRSRLMATAGMGASAFFLFVIAAQALPIVLIDPCLQ